MLTRPQSPDGKRFKLWPSECLGAMEQVGGSAVPQVNLSPRFSSKLKSGFWKTKRTEPPESAKPLGKLARTAEPGGENPEAAKRALSPGSRSVTSGFVKVRDLLDQVVEVAP